MERFTLASALTFAVASAPGPARGLELYPTHEAKFSYVVANGIIGPGDAAKLRSLLQRNLTRKRSTAILLTSPGGALEAVESLGAAILEESDALFSATGKPNIFAINEECSSACAVLATLLTHRRDGRSLLFLVHPQSKFGFHSGAVGYFNRGTFVQDKGSAEIAMRRQLTAFREYGVNPAWLSKNEDLFAGRKVTFKIGIELCLENSLVIPTDSCMPGRGDVLPTIAKTLSR